MDDVLQFVINTNRNFEAGEVANYPDPADPEDLGSALTQEEIDTLKKIVKEIKERYTDLSLL